MRKFLSQGPCLMALHIDEWQGKLSLKTSPHGRSFCSGRSLVVAISSYISQIRGLPATRRAIHDAHHEKIDLKVFVVVIPKEGWARMAAPILLLVWQRLFGIWLCWHHRLYSQKIWCHAKTSFFWYDNNKDLLRSFFSWHTSNASITEQFCVYLEFYLS